VTAYQFAISSAAVTVSGLCLTICALVSAVCAIGRARTGMRAATAGHPVWCATCGHPESRHDAGECWTDPDGNETHGETVCPCDWYEPARPQPDKDTHR
jgi:hypothetical protein